MIGGGFYITFNSLGNVNNNLTNSLNAQMSMYRELAATFSNDDVVVRTCDNISNYKLLVFIIYYGNNEYYASMTVTTNLFKGTPIVPYFPNYHNETTFYKGRVSYIDDNNVMLTAPIMHGIKVVGIK